MIVDVVLVVLAIPVVAWTTYLGALAVLSRDGDLPAAVSPQTRFDIIVPAHNEEAGISATVQSLLAVDYPAALRRVIVVADNCRDATAARAAEAGALVIERHDTERKGKGYALSFAFEWSQNDGRADAVVVVDADTQVSPNLLTAFGSRIGLGAHAVQAEYAVLNRGASWRTRLMHVAFTLFHDVRSRARERLGASAGLRGNGMAFSIPLLRDVPHGAFSIVEDVEYGIALGLAGYRVHYAGEAKVFGEMAASEGASRSQRQRWEGGRWALARRYAGELLQQGFQRRSPILFDLAADLLVPPLTYVAMAAACGSVVSLAWATLGHGAWWVVLPWCFAMAGLTAYIARGVWLARVGPRALLDLAWAPVYMLWKVALLLRGSAARKGEWVRTAREGEKH